MLALEIKYNANYDNGNDADVNCYYFALLKVMKNIDGENKVLTQFTIGTNEDFEISKKVNNIDITFNEETSITFANNVFTMEMCHISGHLNVNYYLTKEEKEQFESELNKFIKNFK